MINKISASSLILLIFALVLAVYRKPQLGYESVTPLPSFFFREVT